MKTEAKALAEKVDKLQMTVEGMCDGIIRILNDHRVTTNSPLYYMDKDTKEIKERTKTTWENSSH